MENGGSVNKEGDDMSLEERINTLQEKHAELELALEEENRRPLPDAATVKEIKHRKLAIKDEITKLGSH